MGAGEVAEQARQLGDRQTAGAGEQRRAMAQALAQRARHLGRVSNTLSGGVLELHSAMRILHTAKLLAEEDEASGILPYLDKRISELLNHEGEVLARRGIRRARVRRARSLASSETASSSSGPALAPLPIAPAVRQPEEGGFYDSRWWGLVNQQVLC